MAALVDDALVIVLAGGAGERLYPLTKDRAKPAVYFGGPYRIIDFALSNARLTDAPVEISGRGVPFFTVSPRIK